MLVRDMLWVRQEEMRYKIDECPVQTMLQISLDWNNCDSFTNCDGSCCDEKVAIDILLELGYLLQDVIRDGSLCFYKHPTAERNPNLCVEGAVYISRSRYSVRRQKQLLQRAFKNYNSDVVKSSHAFRPRIEFLLSVVA